MLRTDYRGDTGVGGGGAVKVSIEHRAWSIGQKIADCGFRISDSKITRGGSGQRTEEKMMNIEQGISNFELTTGY